jgi:hypothetical protein
MDEVDAITHFLSGDQMTSYFLSIHLPEGILSIRVQHNSGEMVVKSFFSPVRLKSIDSLMDVNYCWFTHQ